MTGRESPIARFTSRDATSASVVSTLVTGLAVVAVFLALGLVAELVYHVAPPGFALPGLVVTVAVLGFGGLYAVLRLEDWLE